MDALRRLHDTSGLFATLSRRVLCAGLAAGLCCGCTANSRVQGLEARLREQDSLLADYRRELEDVRQESELARQDAAMLRRQMSSSGESPVLPEQSEAMFRAVAVKFSKFTTGGLDEDGRPGDERLRAVLTPVDEQGEAIKLSGSIELAAREVKSHRSLGHWTFDVDQAREHWTNDLLHTGYVVNVDWQKVPQASEVELAARFKTPDGRTFDAAHTLEVTPLAAGAAAENPVQQAAFEKSAAPPVTAEAARAAALGSPESTKMNAAGGGANGRSLSGNEFSELIEQMPRELPKREAPANLRPRPKPLSPPTRQPQPDAMEENPFEGLMPAAEKQTPEPAAQEMVPFPSGTRTSDLWSDETIPYAR